MTRPRRSPFLCGGVVLLLVAGAAGAQQESAEPQWKEPWIPCLHELVLMAEARAQEPAPAPAGVTCPCFDGSDLASLERGALDLCLRSTYVDQATRWTGGRSSAGQVGFNVLVSMPNPRSPQSSCLFLRRYPSANGVQQTHRRFVNLPEPQAAACRHLLVEWMESRGGCADTTLIRD